MFNILIIVALSAVLAGQVFTSQNILCAFGNILQFYY